MADVLTAGSLCTGAGMLDRAVETVLGPLNWAWHAETDPAASAVLEHHYPDVENLGDITAIDWTRVQPVDVLCGGYPCQGFSYAGLRLGEEDERFIWPHIFAAVRDLRPRIVLLENVPGHLSLGFGRVLGDLASIGYDARWMCLRASDVGAPHQRNRVFIAAEPADASSPRLEARRQGRTRGGDAADAEGLGHGNGRTAGIGGIPAAAVAGGPAALLPTPRTSDTNGAGSHGSGGLDLRTAVALLPTPAAVDSRGARNATSGRKDGSVHHDGWTLSDIAYADRWGDYAPAIARWEQVMGRPAPEPVEPNRKGNGVRLAAPFVEWLMGIPAGWVTDHVKRNDALRILGNGVVWQQAAAAYRALGVNRSVVTR